MELYYRGDEYILTGIDSVRAREISHVNTMNIGDLLQPFTMSFMYYLSLTLLVYLTVFITLYNRCEN